jgi:hypothetical protein
MPPVRAAFLLERCGFLSYLRRDATALRSKLVLSMWNITSSFLKDSDGMKRRTALTLRVLHKRIRMSMVGFGLALRHGFVLAPGVLPGLRWANPVLERGKPAICDMMRPSGVS